LLFKPGSQARYSNAALFVLGRIIEVASGKPYAQLARERILDPLGMEDTWYAPPASEAGRVAAICAERQGQRSAIFRFNPDLEISNTAPDGGLFSYPAEIYRFLQMFLDNDGKVLSQKAVREMLKEQSPGWGLGWALEDGCFSHAGSSGTSAFADPKSGVIGILFFQFRDQKDRVSALSADFRRQVRAAFAADTTRDAKEP
jgi:CubicO group peptidase (beta-lactamase class C family)